MTENQVSSVRDFSSILSWEGTSQDHIIYTHGMDVTIIGNT